MTTNKSSKRVFRDLQHKFRGLVSAFKSQKFVKGRRYSASSLFRLSLRTLLLHARVSLHTSQFSDFLTWVNHHTTTLLPELSRVPVGYDDLSGVITAAPKASLERDLVWIATRIKTSSEKINTFRSHAQQVEYLVFKADIESAINQLQKIESEFGASMWAVQLRLALEQQAGGLERQKRYSAEVRGVYRRGLLAFITSRTSVRNEDKTTLGKYLEDVKHQIDNHKYYDSSVKTYLHYRLAGELSTSKSSIADVLRVEQSHSLLDIYETFIAVLQKIICCEDLEDLQEVAIKCIRSLRTIKDYRLIKAEFILTGCGPIESLDKRELEISDALLTGNVKLSALIFRSKLNLSRLVDPWQLIYAGFAFGHGTRERLSRYSRPRDIPQLIGRVQSRCGISIESLGTLSKLATNLSGLPSANGIIDLIQQLQRSGPDDELRPWTIGLNSPFLGIEDLSPRGALLDYACLFNHSKTNATEEAWKYFHNAESVNARHSNPIYYLFSAAGLVRDRQYQKAIDTIKEKSVQQSSEPLKNMIISVLLHASYAIGNRQAVIEIIANEGARGEAFRQLLPVKSALENYQWTDYKTLTSPLMAPIALHLLWLENENTETASFLRLSTRQFLKESNVQLPSKLYDLAENYPTHQLIYFLSRVCVPNILDVSSALKSSREVMEERQKVCVALRLLDSANADQYLREIGIITHQQTLDEGQWIVDRTRIHVDTEALTRWASKELSEVYSRYRDLLEVDVGPEVDIDELLKEATKDGLIQYSSFAPESEADALLISILGRVSEEFLNNPSFGLDFYLSQRIRHQSFIGKIRGPVEFAQLITTRESEAGGYHPNTERLDKLGNTSEESRSIISGALSKFSERFDESLIVAKEERFQIRNQDQPSGLLFLSLPPRLIFFLREITRIDETLSDFIDTAMVMLWAALEPSLEQVRNFITVDLKTNAAEAFDELRATVKRYSVEDDPAFLDLDLAIGQCSADVQRAFDDAAQWFTRANDVKALQRSFELEQMINIAINSALKCQRAFDPIITKNINDGNTRLSASTLIFINDVLFVALDNVRAHSGIKTPRVSVAAHIDIVAETFTISVRSEIKTQNRILTEGRLTEIRDLIHAGAFERRTRREGGSGFLKLAAVVHQVPKGEIDFGINETGEFELTVVYSLIIQAVPPEVANE